MTAQIWPTRSSCPSENHSLSLMIAKCLRSPILLSTKHYITNPPTSLALLVFYRCNVRSLGVRMQTSPTNRNRLFRFCYVVPSRLAILRCSISVHLVTRWLSGQACRLFLSLNYSISKLFNPFTPSMLRAISSIT